MDSHKYDRRSDTPLWFGHRRSGSSDQVPAEIFPGNRSMVHRNLPRHIPKSNHTKRAPQNVFDAGYAHSRSILDVTR